MKKHIFATLAVLIQLSLLAYSVNVQRVIDDVDRLVVVKQQTILKIVSEMAACTNDFAKFKTQFVELDVPRTRVVTNWISKSFFTTRVKKIPEVVRRERRLLMACQDEVLNQLYFKYFKTSLTGIGAEMQSEIDITKENYRSMLAKLDAKNSEYEKKMKSIDMQRESDLRRSLNEIDYKIKAVKTNRHRNCQVRNDPRVLNGECPFGSTKWRCNSCSRYDNEIVSLNQKKTDIKKMFSVTKYSDKKIGLIDEKTGGNDRELAKNDYETARQAVYMTFKAKIVDNFAAKIQSFLEVRQSELDRIESECSMLRTISENKDILTDETARKIRTQVVDKALKQQFGINSEGLTLSELEARKSLDDRRKAFNEDLNELNQIMDAANDREIKLMKAKAEIERERHNAELIEENARLRAKNEQEANTIRVILSNQEKKSDNN